MYTEIRTKTVTLDQRQQVGGVQQEDDRAEDRPLGTPHTMTAGVGAVDPVRTCWRRPTSTTGATAALLRPCHMKSEVVEEGC